MNTHDQLMRRAIEVCRAGIAAGQSPFGAVIAGIGGDVVCEAHNTVRAGGDPTAHAEVNAIRQACRLLGTIDLTGHVLVTTCEPCPMCAAAAHWAGLDEVVCGATIEDARNAGFSELGVSCASLYRQGDSRVKIYRGVLQAQCRDLFRLWLEGPNPHPY